MAITEQLFTERLVLRAFQETDFDAVHAYASEAENIHFMIWGPNSKEDTETFLKDCLKKAELNPRRAYDYAITLKQPGEDVDKPGKVIGGCGIYLSKRRKIGELGWILHRDYWKQGIAAEVGLALLHYGFTSLGLHRLYAICNADNYGSYRVMEKLGMRREAHLIQARYGRVGTKQMWYDTFEYAILKEEWEARQISET